MVVNVMQCTVISTNTMIVLLTHEDRYVGFLSLSGMRSK